MNRKDIVKMTATKLGITKQKDIDKLYEFILFCEDEIKNTVKNGETVNLVGFMKISPKKVEARECHLVSNPEKRFIEAHYSVSVKPSKSFKTFLNHH